MNVAFIASVEDYRNLKKPLQSQEQIQFGISYISSFLKSYGHNTRLLVLTRDTKEEIIDEFLKEFRPELVCFTAVFSEYGFISKVARYIKANYPSIWLLAGGPHVSLNPEEGISDSFDALCIGEGEYPTLELVEQLRKRQTPSEIPNLWIKTGGKIEKNRPRPFLQDLDSLPSPDIEMWQGWINRPETRPMILLSRGCPFQCTYCCNHALAKIAPGNYVRFRSSDNILREVKEIIVKFPKTQEVYFETETIGADMEFAIELCSKLEQLNKELDKPLSFGINFRVTPNMDYENLFAALGKSNCTLINIGIESGSERVRRKILKRNYSNQDIVRAVELARQHGLKVNVTNMIGIPGETLADFRETIKCNRECLPDHCQVSIFFPYPGTDLYELCEKEGLLGYGLDARWERRKASLHLPEFPKKQIQHQYTWFYYNVFKGHKPMHVLLVKVIALKVYSSYKLTRLFRILKLYWLLSKVYRIPIIGRRMYNFKL